VSVYASRVEAEETVEPRE